MKGQVTLFLILSLLAVGLGIYTLFSVQTNPEAFSPSSITEVETYIGECLKQQIEENILLHAELGGYWTLPDDSVFPYEYEVIEGDAVYYLYDGILFNPTIDILENELILSSKESLAFCTDLDIAYEYASDLESAIIDFQFGDKNTMARIDVPITLTLPEKKYQAGDMVLTFPTAFYSLYTLAQTITYLQYQEGSSQCISCLNELSLEENTTITMTEFEDETGHVVIYTLLKDDTRFRFAHHLERDT